MKARLLVTGSFFFCALSATAQLSGTFYLDKTTFAPGEPIFLHFKVSNHGAREGILDITGLPEQPVCAGYLIEISRNPPIASACQNGYNGYFEGCSYDGPISVQTIKPGKSFTERILLNFDSEVHEPGEYSIHAKYLDHIGGPENQLNAETRLHLRVDRAAPGSSCALFQPWVDQLNFRDRRKRIEAAQVLASLAPRCFENVLLSFAHDPDLREFAPLAFHRLNSRRSIAALAALITGSSTNERGQAAFYLAETGDQKWLSLLLAAAEKNADDSWFPTAAAELGGEKAVPSLVSIEKNQYHYAALNAVMALGYTGSRAAIPYLLEYLKRPELDIDERANGSLQMLTHRTAKAGGQITLIADYPKWSLWWKREGATAPIYKEPPIHCAPLQLQPLP